MRIIYFILLLLYPIITFTQTIEAQTYNIIEENGAYGVEELFEGDSSSIIIQPIYDYIEILDSAQLIEARRYSLIPGDSTYKLPAPVIEYYNINGDIVQRNVNQLLEADKDGTFCREYQKRYFSTEMDVAIMTKEAINEKIKGRRREAYQKYMEIYRKYPSLEFAKEAANDIKSSIRNDRQEVLAQMAQEAAEIHAAMEQLSASLQQLSNTIGQISASRQKTHTSRPVQTRSKEVAQNTSTSSNNKTTRHNHKTTKSKITETQKEKNSSQNSSKGSMWCFNKEWVKCTLCNGSGKCVFCTGRGKIVGYVIRTCDSCHGSGTCSRCKGTKQIYQ